MQLSDIMVNLRTFEATLMNYCILTIFMVNEMMNYIWCCQQRR
uniref:Uncharacterized protein n=1 Tax=Setaria italica TaxID=4555 RepID=K3XU08_SETIT